MERLRALSGVVGGVRHFLLLPLLVFAIGAGVAARVSHRVAVESAETELIRRAGEMQAQLSARLEQIGGLVAGAAAHWSRTDHTPAAITGEELRAYISAAEDGETSNSLPTGLVYILRVGDDDLDDLVALRRRSDPEFRIGELTAGSQHALAWAQSGDAFRLGTVWNANEARRNQLTSVSANNHVLASMPLPSETGRTVIDVVGRVSADGVGLPLGWIGTEVDVQEMMIESINSSEGVRWTMRDGSVVLGDIRQLPDPTAPLLSQTIDIQILGRAWQLTATTAEPAFDASLLLSGLLLSTILATMTWRLSRSRLTYRDRAMAAMKDRNRSESFADTVMESIDIGILAVDAAGTITVTNKAAKALYDAQLSLGSELEDWTSHSRLLDDSGEGLAFDQMPLVLALRGETTKDAEVPVRQSNGIGYYLVNATPLLDPEQGTAIGAVASVQDITEQKHSLNEMGRLAMHDHLTGLPNRRRLHDVLERALDAQRAGGEQVTLLFMDLDSFKEVNDALGHHRGDRMLIDIARRLQEFVHDDDLVARIGGDEFVLLCTHQTSDRSAVTFAQEAADCMAPVLGAGDTQIRCESSVGVVRPENSASIDDVLRHADLAMYVAKAESNTTIAVYRRELDTRAAAQRKMEHDLRRAIHEDQLSVAFQPQAEADGLEIVAMEALVRWNHDGEMRSPGLFLPVAENSDLIIDLDLWVLREACRTAALPEMPSNVSVNMASRTLALVELADHVQAALDAAGIKPDQLCLELTETSLIGASDVMDASLQGLADMGVTLALDDFGTGYASLSYLRRFPVDVIKIDRSFVDGMNDNENDRAIIAASIQLSTNLGLSTVAEGVETVEQRDTLIELGCNRLQGYFFGHPMFPHEWPTVDAAHGNPEPPPS